MRVPEVQDELRFLAEQHNMPRLAELADELYRRRSLASPTKAERMSEALAAKIRLARLENPDLPQYRIASMFNVNPGRVSEALSGKRR